MAGLERVAFVGLGIMGGPMARNLREAGFELSVYTRTRKKAERFAAEHGVRAAATPAEAAEGADALITMVPDAPQVEEVLFGEAGAAEALPDEALVVDMSTTSPTSSRATLCASPWSSDPRFWSSIDMKARTAAKYCNNATTRHLHPRPGASRRASADASSGQCRPFASRGFDGTSS